MTGAMKAEESKSETYMEANPYRERTQTRLYGINIRVSWVERSLFNQACALNDDVPSRILRRAMKDYVDKAKVGSNG